MAGAVASATHSFVASGVHDVGVSVTDDDTTTRAQVEARPPEVSPEASA